MGVDLNSASQIRNYYDQMRQRPMLFAKYLAAEVNLDWATSLPIELLQFIYLLAVDINYQRGLLCADKYYETTHPMYEECFNTVNPWQRFNWGWCPYAGPSVSDFNHEEFMGTWFEKYRDRTIWYESEETHCAT